VIGKANTHFSGMLNSGMEDTILVKIKFVLLADEIHTFCKMKNKQILQPGFQFQR
jgi:hypothetical protein